MCVLLALRARQRSDRLAWKCLRWAQHTSVLHLIPGRARGASTLPISLSSLPNSSSASLSACASTSASNLPSSFASSSSFSSGSIQTPSHTARYQSNDDPRRVRLNCPFGHKPAACAPRERRDSARQKFPHENPYWAVHFPIDMRLAIIANDLISQNRTSKRKTEPSNAKPNLRLMSNMWPRQNRVPWAHVHLFLYYAHQFFYVKSAQSKHRCKAS